VLTYFEYILYVHNIVLIQTNQNILNHWIARRESHLNRWPSLIMNTGIYSL